MKLLPLLLLFCFICSGQKKIAFDQKQDSVIYYLNNAEDSLRLPYLKKAIQLAKKIENDSLLRLSVIEYANTGYFSGNSEENIKGINELKLLYSQKNDSFALAKLYHIKAMIFKSNNQLDSSFYYYQESKNTSHLIHDSLQVGRRLLSMGLMQKNENDLVGAESTLIQALEFLEPKNENRFIGNTYNNLGLVLLRFGRNEEAREYFKKSFEAHKKNTHVNSKEKGFLDFYNSMGLSYIQENNFESAIPILNEGLNLKTKEKHISAHQALLGNIADCLFEIDKKRDAWSKTFELLGLREETNNLYGQSLSHNGIAYYYQQENKNKKALFHAKKGYDLAKEVNNNATVMSALLKLGALTSGKESKQYYQEYAYLSDSLNNRERYLKNQFAKVRYETEKKDKENVNLKRISEQRQREAENERQQKIIFGLLGFLGVVIVFGYAQNRRKKMMYEAQLQKASAREEERQQIAKSLHDEVAGDLRMLHQKLVQSNQEEAKSIETIKDNVRNLSHQLSSVSFEEVSFKDQLINLISDVFSPNFKVATEGLNEVLWREINNTIKRTLYLCIRESLQNTLKYAEATTFSISFSTVKKEIVVHLKDNGKGMNVKKTSKGIGLKNLRERVEEIHGSFELESSERGTNICVKIPING